MCVIFKDRCRVVHVPFVRMVKFKFLAHLSVYHLVDPVVSSLIFFPSNLLHSLLMWLLVSSLSPYSLHLLFCCVLSILALIWLFLKALFCAAIRRDSVSRLKFPFLSLFKFFFMQMLFINRLKRQLLLLLLLLFLLLLLLNHIIAWNTWNLISIYGRNSTPVVLLQRYLSH